MYEGGGTTDEGMFIHTHKHSHTGSKGKSSPTTPHSKYSFPDVFNFPFDRRRWHIFELTAFSNLGVPVAHFQMVLGLVLSGSSSERIFFFQLICRRTTSILAAGTYFQSHRLDEGFWMGRSQTC